MMIQPVFLTCYHMAVASVGTRVLRYSPIDRLRPKTVDLSVSYYAVLHVMTLLSIII